MKLSCQWYMNRRHIIILVLLLVEKSIGQTSHSLENFGKASFYHDKFHGRVTSNGEIYDKNDFTAAHLTFPYNTILLVTNKKNNRSVVVRINDRGPYKRSRVIDLSHAAAKKIGMVPFGVVQVKIKVLNFLDPGLMNDSLLHDGDLWDCYGNKRKMSDKAIFLWKTVNWKHAFYMASCLSLEYNLSSIAVKVSDEKEKKNYELIVTNLENIDAPDKLISGFMSDGFFDSGIIYKNPLKVKPPSGRLSK